ncbi:LPS export ABC transporter periplasmic protein LptC [Exilibacterium tricleocarpae]|uniref:Lipopolysaccharide export system protein LptC n=1 Tax=Exilibacterium tricleocarpae TaxID=2591008 RepID=A0A545TSI4_9GAMM|nr:LPS export ABC transporter periplasmic protein LptC [Exilibacterium tricleocarpae]TQV80176.1 LPS export ABC transporter periplasmic protein LptC [Exilibacterium tricleocarpae]
MPRHWLSLAVFAALTLAVVLLWESPPTDLLGAPAEPAPAATYPSIYLTGVEVVQFDEQGTVNYRFNAERSDHFQRKPGRQTAGDYTEITTPYFIFYNNEGPPRYVRAREGHTDALGQVITLTQDVRVWQKNVDEQLQSELTTPKLVVRPDDQYAETDKPVRMLGADGEVDAIGMKAYFDQDRIELLSRVRGVHEPR